MSNYTDCVQRWHHVFDDRTARLSPKNTVLIFPVVKVKEIRTNQRDARALYDGIKGHMPQTKFGQLV